MERKNFTIFKVLIWISVKVLWKQHHDLTSQSQAAFVEFRQFYIFRVAMHCTTLETDLCSKHTDNKFQIKQDEKIPANYLSTRGYFKWHRNTASEALWNSDFDWFLELTESREWVARVL